MTSIGVMVMFNMSTNIGVTLMTNVYVHFRVNVFVGIDLGTKEN